VPHEVTSIADARDVHLLGILTRAAALAAFLEGQRPRRARVREISTVGGAGLLRTWTC
jgi:hypothetical protein